MSQRLGDGQRGIELLHRVLGEIAPLNARANGHAARIGLGGASHQLEQGRLAGTVDAHHAPALAAAHEQVEAAIDLKLTVTLVHGLELDHLVSRARRWSKVEARQLAPLARLHEIDLVDLLLSRLNLRSMARAGLEPLDEGVLLGQHRLLSCGLCLDLRLEQVALRFVEIVVTGKRAQLSRIDLDDSGDPRGSERRDHAM